MASVDGAAGSLKTVGMGERKKTRITRHQLVSAENCVLMAELAFPAVVNSWSGVGRKMPAVDCRALLAEACSSLPVAFARLFPSWSLLAALCWH